MPDACISTKQQAVSIMYVFCYRQQCVPDAESVDYFLVVVEDLGGWSGYRTREIFPRTAEHSSISYSPTALSSVFRRYQP